MMATADPLSSRSRRLASGVGQTQIDTVANVAGLIYRNRMSYAGGHKTPRRGRLRIKDLLYIRYRLHQERSASFRVIYF
jgi:hypothetical protein